jgi:hypothetical protein
MARWEQDTGLATMLAKHAEMSLLRLSKENAGADARTRMRPAENAGEPMEWRVGVGPLPPFLLVRQRGEDIEIAVDLVSPALQAVETIHNQPGEYIAASAGAGALFGAVVGRSRRAAVLGGTVGCLLGLLSVLDERGR